MSDCPVTGRLLPTGFYVHPDCAEDFVRIGAALVSSVVSDAEAVRDKFVTPGGSDGGVGVPGPRLPIRPGAFYPVEESIDVLHVWAFAAMQFIRPDVRLDVYRMSWEAIGKIFIKYSVQLCRWIDAPTALDECQDAIRRLSKLSQPKMPSKVIKCPACEGTSYYAFDLDHLVCKQCGGLIERRAAIESMRTQALEKLMPLANAVELVRAFGYQVADATVRSWVRRGKLKLEPGRKTRPRNITEILDKVQR